MRITFQIPDHLADQLAPTDRDPARTALEAMAIDAYRNHRLTGYQLREVLEIPNRYDFDAFLKEHQVWLEYSVEDYEREGVLTERLWRNRQTELAEETIRQNR